MRELEIARSNLAGSTICFDVEILYMTRILVALLAINRNLVRRSFIIFHIFVM